MFLIPSVMPVPSASKICKQHMLCIWPCQVLILMSSGSWTALLREELKSVRSGPTLPPALFRYNQFTQWHSVDGTVQGLELDSCPAKGWCSLLLLLGSVIWHLVDSPWPGLVTVALPANSEPTPLTMSYFPPSPFFSDYPFCYLLIFNCNLEESDERVSCI